MVTEIILPKLGQTMEDGAIVEWLKQEGDEIKRGDVLFTVESDKATLEVEASARGFLRKILVPAGKTVTVLSAVALMTKTADEDIDAGAVAGAVGQGEEATATAAEMEPTMPETELPESGAADRGRIFASPRARKAAGAEGINLALLAGTGPEGRIVERDVLAYLEAAPKITPVARRLAEQAGLDPRALTGSGGGGRITKEDVEAALTRQQAIAAPPALIPIVRPAEAAAEGDAVPMSGVRAVIARRMAESHQTTAPVTLTTEVDATEFVVARQRLKEKLAGELGFNVGYNDLLIKLVAKGLRELPYMNSRLQGESILQLSDVHVALAVDTDRGLLVPVIRAADRKGLRECARELREVVERARDGKALPDELTGSTFTITNLGMHEIDAFTPIINLPEAAILGVGRIKPQPAVFNGEIAIRQMMWLSLTFD
ncbi:MAG TPA: dihydrolipoamide acetyltransferase family protein, partial [Anaerolineae bacterium]|nr:dihydrolipoamide acetyltransferase family protein [Anaerolineae bacterium]